jgi:hypothetical protein
MSTSSINTTGRDIMAMATRSMCCAHLPMPPNG